MSVYVHCKTHRKRSGIEMNETLNLHRQRTKWTVDIELDKTKSDLRKNLNLEVKTRQIRNEVRDSVKADSNVTNPALQQKINRERKKLNLSSTKITLNEL